MRSEVRTTIGTFISGNKVNQLRSEEDKKATFAEKDPVASSLLKKVCNAQYAIFITYLDLIQISVIEPLSYKDV